MVRRVPPGGGERDSADRANQEDRKDRKIREDRKKAEAHWGEAMAAGQAGDAETYQKLLEEIVPVMRRQARARLSDPSAAEDVVQNALLSIHRARHTYRPERPFGPWMRTIVRNQVIDHLRSSMRRSRLETHSEFLEELPDPNPASVDDPNEIDPRIAEALEALPEKQRQAVVMIQLQGLSVAEAALKANVTAGALKVRAHRGYRRLAELLRERPA
jgi:RNA polymerase sigma factor (sigma-70 family)